MGFIWDACQWFHFKVEWMSFFSSFFSSFFIPFSSSPPSLSSWCRSALWDHSCRSLMWGRTLQCRISLFAISPLKSCLLLPCFLDRDNCHAGWCLVLHPSTGKVWVVVSITVDFTHPVETLFSFTYCTIGEDIKFTDGVCNLFQKMVYGFSLT